MTEDQDTQIPWFHDPKVAWFRTWWGVAVACCWSYLGFILGFHLLVIDADPDGANKPAFGFLLSWGHWARCIGWVVWCLPLTVWNCTGQPPRQRWVRALLQSAWAILIGPMFLMVLGLLMFFVFGAAVTWMFVQIGLR